MTDTVAREIHLNPHSEVYVRHIDTVSQKLSKLDIWGTEEGGVLLIRDLPLVPGNPGHDHEIVVVRHVGLVTPVTPDAGRYLGRFRCPRGLFLVFERRHPSAGRPPSTGS